MTVIIGICSVLARQHGAGGCVASSGEVVQSLLPCGPMRRVEDHVDPAGARRTHSCRGVVRDRSTSSTVSISEHDQSSELQKDARSHRTAGAP